MEKKFEDFTLIDGALNLSRQQGVKAETRKDDSEPDFGLRESSKPTKLKRSRMTSGHGMQGHSPFYE